MNERTPPADAEKRNRSVEDQKGRAANSGTSAELGQRFGRAENPESGEIGSTTATEDDRGTNEAGSTGSSEGRH